MIRRSLTMGQVLSPLSLVVRKHVLIEDHCKVNSWHQKLEGVCGEDETGLGS